MTDALLAVERFKSNALAWRGQLALPGKLALALGFAALTGLLAQLRLPIPGSPVPITGQTLAVLLAGVTLGGWWGGVSMGLYALLGIAGIPWFSAGSSGLGATGGYLIGFVLAALFLGYVTDRFASARRFIPMLGLMLVANFLLIYIPGLLWLRAWLGAAGVHTDLSGLIAMGAAPFVIGDLVKIAMAAGIGRAAIPGQIGQKTSKNPLPG